MIWHNSIVIRHQFSFPEVTPVGLEPTSSAYETYAIPAATASKSIPPVRLDHYRDPTPLPSFAKHALRKAQRYCILHGRPGQDYAGGLSLEENKKRPTESESLQI